jgi:DNA-binding LytR/AlgR family response regulator
MENRFEKFITIFKQDLRLFLSISFGVFLFILFFEPFPLQIYDFNNRLIFVAGYAAIFFVFMNITGIVFRWSTADNGKIIHEPVLASYLEGFILFILNSVSTAFYLRYVADVLITFPIMVKALIIGMIPTVSLWMHDSYIELLHRNKSLVREKEQIQEKVELYADEFQNKTVEFLSEYKDENLKLNASDVILIKSANNYVEIVFHSGDTVKKQLIRNTLRNIEQILKPYSFFVRCHRICIVNTLFVEKINKKFNNIWVDIIGYDEQIPVSRQYLLKLQENIPGRDE